MGEHFHNPNSQRRLSLDFELEWLKVEGNIDQIAFFTSEHAGEENVKLIFNGFLSCMFAS